MWKKLYEKLLDYFGSMYFAPDGTCRYFYGDDDKEGKL